MSRKILCFVLVLLGPTLPLLRAATPPLLAKALQRWDLGEGDMAFTQQTRVFHSDGQVKEERVERYDPSLPDHLRWRLIEVNGQPATEEQRAKWETRKNGKPRKKVDKSPSEYLDLEHAAAIGETPKTVRYRIAFRPEASHLVDLDQVEVVVSVDKQSATIAGVGAALREPVRVLLGLARITDLDVDVHLSLVDGGSAHPEDEVQSGSTARVKISKLGRPVEYNWSDFKRVPSFAGP